MKSEDHPTCIMRNVEIYWILKYWTSLDTRRKGRDRTVNQVCWKKFGKASEKFGMTHKERSTFFCNFELHISPGTFFVIGCVH